MTKKIAYLVVHIEDIEREAKTDNNAKIVLEYIKKMISSVAKEDLFLMPKRQDPRKPPIEQLKSYDKVYVYGAYHGMCLNSTCITLTMHGIRNELDSKGII
ncbi:MAG: hypothetical protein KC589_11495 [Nanoarchaeota archaeon]|nr:hypothetical protein [Nanoarchaeota archaeon]